MPEAIISTGTVRGERPNPLRGFKFRVKDLEGNYLGGYNRISGLKDNTDVSEYREGDQIGNYTEKMAGISNHDDVVLERGFSIQGFMREWRDKVMKWDDLSVGLADDVDGYYMDLQIEVLNRKGEIVRKINLYRAFPISYEIDDLDARSSDVIMERVTLACEGTEVITI